ncbi:hypothetical protein KGA66_16400 [Actinocrinis puniceicyclus]|uniref:Carrier domain-containing protein n=1 Tax=Actinocrinis puniceicyclus TaxID=977794 RepID=A0A8J7WT05_9ACTN|nr:phosphopantetheine-binding protein [Actinocrinis puniceicyclus]MBS2964639.1 hypothetical protein [Actinocrinis puniceicyclus]
MANSYDALVDLLVHRFDVDPAKITPQATFEDLEIDSLFMVELLLVVQAELGVELSDDAATPRDTIAKAAELISAHAAAAAS